MKIFVVRGVFGDTKLTANGGIEMVVLGASYFLK